MPGAPPSVPASTLLMKSILLSSALYFGAAATAGAVNVIFTLTGASTASVAGSSITVAGVGTAPGTQQTAGSLGPRAVSGTITVDVDNVLAPTTLQFVSATLNPADFGSNLQPAVGGTAGSAVAEFGLQFALGPFGTEFVAWRNSVTSLSSSLITVTGGAYSTTGITFTPIAGTVDYGTVATGTGNLTSLTPSGNVANTVGNYGVSGNTATLTLPGFDYTFATSFNGTPGTIRFTGSLTGTATVVPEPGAAVWAFAGLALLVKRRRRA